MADIFRLKRKSSRFESEVAHQLPDVEDVETADCKPALSRLQSYRGVQVLSAPKGEIPNRSGYQRKIDLFGSPDVRVGPIPARKFRTYLNTTPWKLRAAQADG